MSEKWRAGVFVSSQLAHSGPWLRFPRGGGTRIPPPFNDFGPQGRYPGQPTPVIGQRHKEVQERSSKNQEINARGSERFSASARPPPPGRAEERSGNSNCRREGILVDAGQENKRPTE